MAVVRELEVRTVPFGREPASRRAQWVGCRFPYPADCGPVVNIDREVAFAALAQRDLRSAAWWRENKPHKKIFYFRRDEVMIVDVHTN